MVKKFRSLYTLVGMALLASACEAELISPTATQEEIKCPETIVVSLPGADNGDGTKSSFTFTDGILGGTWNAGDQISVVTSASYFNYAGTYAAQTGGERTTTFSQVSPVKATSKIYGVYYPASIKSDIQFTNFSYVGQVQSKSNPTGHLGQYLSMRKLTTDYSTISFSGADFTMSSCMRIVLGGMTFNNPSRITMKIDGSGSFSLNNYLSTWYTGPAESKDDNKTSKSISIDLTGYGAETRLEAFIAMSNKDVTINAGDKITMMVICSDGAYTATETVPSNVTIPSGTCQSYYVNGGWSKTDADMTDYSAFETAVTLQTASVGNGLDLVIMGDGFIKEDHDNGTYENIMRQAMDEFFGVEPLASFKDYFNVYYVKAVSPQRTEAKNIGTNGADNSGNLTRFSCSFTQGSTSISGDNTTIMEFARKALTTNTAERMKNATIVVMANAPARAGTCYNSWGTNSSDYGEACAIAFCALGHDDAERVQLMRHEICGHGFGKLADEYSYPITSFTTAWWNELQEHHTKGLFRNVDKYVTQNFRDSFTPGSSFATMELTQNSEILWNDMIGTANAYESAAKESLGFYEGAYTYNIGFCRPTEDGNKSIMNHNTGIFNAISRRQMYYRIMSLAGIPGKPAGSFGTAAELNDFLNWDAANFHYPALSSAPAARLNSVEIDERLPFAPPVLIQGTWSEDGVFTPLDR